MASLYKRPRSPFWWIKYRADDGRTKRESTGLRVGIGGHTRKARQLAAEHALRESRLDAGAPHELWGQWVPEWLRLRYKNLGSLNRRKKAWENMQMFLDEKRVLMPRHVTRELGAEYMAWRRTPNIRKGKYRAGHNTALYEVQMLALVMKEAVLRGYAAFNPCRDLAIKQEETREAPEITDAAYAAIEHGIDRQPAHLREFLRNSFLIGRYHGVRISETYLNPQTHVQLNGAASEITFRAKGGKTHTVLLHPNLHPLFAALKAAGRTETYRPIAGASRQWTMFLDRLGLRKAYPGLCFKSFRVSVACRLTRAGLSERLIMAYLGHASVTVSRAYVRWRPKDVSECLKALP